MRIVAQCFDVYEKKRMQPKAFVSRETLSKKVSHEKSENQHTDESKEQ